MAEESLLDRLADEDTSFGTLEGDFDAPQSTAAEGEGKGADADAPPASSAPAPDTSATDARFERLEQQMFESREREAYWRGQATRNNQPPPAVEQPKAFDLEGFKAKLEKDPGAAIIEAFNELSDQKLRGARAEIEQSVDGKVGQTQRMNQMREAMQAEAREITNDYPDLVGNDDNGKPKNPAFDAEAWAYAQDLAAKAGNPVIQEGQHAGSRAMTPGMMRAAADAVYGKWARMNKLPAKTEVAPTNGNRSLREIIDQVPRSDSMGSNGNGRNARSAGLPKTIEQLADAGHFGPGDKAKHVRRAKALINQMGWKEENYVANALAATRNGELDA